LRSSSVSSSISSQSNVTDMEASSLEKGGWLQAAMKSADVQKEHENDDNKDKKRLSLEDPNKAGICKNVPSPPKLPRERARWDWNEDVDSEDEQVLWG